MGRARAIVKQLEFEHIPYQGHGPDCNMFLKDVETALDNSAPEPDIQAFETAPK